MEKGVWKRITVKEGDITLLQVDAIVNAANSSLLGGGGVDGAIHRAAGPELLSECRKLGGCPTGEARITRAYRLPSTYVIHTVGPVYSGKPEDKELLASCYRSSILLALEYQVKSIAFPSISCGVYGYPIEDASRIAVQTCAELLREHFSIERIVFVVFSSAHEKVYHRVIDEAINHEGVL